MHHLTVGRRGSPCAESHVSSCVLSFPYRSLEACLKLVSEEGIQQWVSSAVEVHEHQEVGVQEGRVSVQQKRSTPISYVKKEAERMKN